MCECVDVCGGDERYVLLAIKRPKNSNGCLITIKTAKRRLLKSSHSLEERERGGEGRGGENHISLESV